MRLGIGIFAQLPCSVVPSSEHRRWTDYIILSTPLRQENNGKIERHDTGGR
jgi:hypothetical protein